MKSLSRALLALAAALVALLGFGAAAGAAPYVKTLTVGVSSSNVHAGMSITISGSGATPNGNVQLVLNSATLGMAIVNANGDYSASVTLPDLCGSHALTATDVTSHQVATTQLTFPACSPAGGSSGGSGGLSNTGVAVASIGGLGALLVIGGGLLLLFGRRRRATI